MTNKRPTTNETGSFDPLSGSIYPRFVSQSDNDPPLKPPQDIKPTTPAPAWVAFLAAWLGLIMLIASVVFVFLPGSTNAQEELEHHRPYSLADKFLPVPIYGITVALFLGIVVFWQMRNEPRPLSESQKNQRLQAWAGISLALIGTVIIYTWVAFHGPR